MIKVKNITINEKIAMEVGVNASAIYDYILQKVKDGRFYLDIDNIYNEMPIITKSSIRESVKRLVNTNYLKQNMLTSLEKYNILSDKKMIGLGIGNKSCEWCECKTTILHKHHYPVTKKDNGTEMVSICANCHNEYHHLSSELIVNEVSNRG